MKRELLGKLQARGAAMRYRHPSKGLRIIAIGGAYGKTTTAVLLGELFQEAGKSVLLLTNHGTWHNGKSISYAYDTSAQAAQRCLAFARQKMIDIVIIEITDAFVKTHVLPTLTLEMSIITSDSPSAQAVLNQPVNYTVVPSGFEVDGLSVAPHQAISYGEDELAEARLTDVKLYRKGTEIELVIDHQTTLVLTTHLIGKANAYNLGAAVAASYVLAVDIDTLEEGAARCESIAGNFEPLGLERPYSIAVDGAKHIRSFELVLESAATLKKRRLLVALDESVSLEARETAKRLADRVIVVGEDEEVTGMTLATTIDEALDITLRGAKKDDSVLLLGTQFATVESGNITRAHRMIEATGE
jgi:UDP-N-acetylmuramoyl-L-alanyl-D-glutamate--2,6-diaminopimelate ligase